MAPVVIRLDAARSPIEALARFAELPNLCLLQSASPEHPLSRFSYLAADPVATISAPAEQWQSACAAIRSTFAPQESTDMRLPPFRGGWMGWLGYDLAVALDDVARHPTQSTPVPDIMLGLHDWVIAWDHADGSTWLVSTGIDSTGQRDPVRAQARAWPVLARWNADDVTDRPHNTSSNVRPQADISAATYQTAVARVIDYILAGDIFQANLAQRFAGPFRGDPLALYADLVRRSPAPMAAFIRHQDVAIVSASPEQFIRLDAATRRVETRPIKGTRPRDANAARDAALAQELLASAKDRAENVMIVDLLRNDLSRVCRPGTVQAPVLCALESHSTVHHLVSLVTGELERRHDAMDLIAATFPGGSITGAPKLRAMAIIRELEIVARGVYSGAIGWIGLDGSMDTSIAIRTVTIAAGTASCHAGGGITALSVPADEYQETLDKAQAMLAAVAATA